MLKEIAEALNIRFDENNFTLVQRLQKIQSKLHGSSSDADWVSKCESAEAEVDNEGHAALQAIVSSVTTPMAQAVLEEKVYKIKRSPKGARVKIAAENGVRFSFGPIWNESVKKGKGIAVAPKNRAKLNHQAILAGIQNPESMEVGALCAIIAKTL